MTIKAHIAESKGPAISKEEAAKQEAKRSAENAVERFESEYSQLQDMRADFQQKFPDADIALQEILKQEDIVRATIGHAHALVQAVKVSIGPFSCTRKWSKAGYDDAALTVVLRQLENRADVMQALLDQGVVEKIVLADAATAFFAQNPEYGEAVKAAWRDKAEKTAAVTDPKI